MRLFPSLTLLVMVSAVQATEVGGPSTAPVPKGTYSLDKAHASLIFRVSHLGFSTYTARFTRYDAKLDFDPERLGNSSVNVTIDPSSATADNLPEGYTDLMAGKQFLDAAQFPEMRFVSKSIDVQGRDLRIHGELTLHGVTRPIVLEARYNGGYASHPYEPRARVGFSAKGEFKRSDFGIGYGTPAPGSTFGVGDEVQVMLEAEFTGPPVKTAQR
jgi:polyisoprenoid-binding protein YceI